MNIEIGVEFHGQEEWGGVLATLIAFNSQTPFANTTIALVKMHRSFLPSHPDYYILIEGILLSKTVTYQVFKLNMKACPGFVFKEEPF